MKRVLVVSCLVMFYHTSYCQNTEKVYATFKSDTATRKDMRLQNDYTFAPIKLPGRCYIMKGYSDEEFTFRGTYEMPGYYPAGEMMSTETMYSAIGNTKFNCNYYFDADGQLQDGDITISKKK